MSAISHVTMLERLRGLEKASPYCLSTTVLERQYQIIKYIKAIDNHSPNKAVEILNS